MTSNLNFLAIALIIIAVVFLLFNSKSKLGRTRLRFQAITGLNPEKANTYFKLHSAVWPEVLKTIERANIRNFSIAVKEIDGKQYLFSYFEYVGKDFDADMKMVAADPETQRWWRETEPCQIPLPDAAAIGAIWSDAEEVFYTP